MADENAYQGYWRVYGGVASLLRSTYFWLGLVITILARGLWVIEAGKTPAWVALATSIVPSLLGFALGGMAIMLAFSSGKFLDAIRQKGKHDSYFMKIIASFFHFAVVLAGALMIALVEGGLSPVPYLRQGAEFAGFFLTVYGILLVLAIVSSVWHTARIFNAVRENDTP